MSTHIHTRSACILVAAFCTTVVAVESSSVFAQWPSNQFNQRRPWQPNQNLQRNPWQSNQFNQRQPWQSNRNTQRPIGQNWFNNRQTPGRWKITGEGDGFQRRWVPGKSKTEVNVPNIISDLIRSIPPPQQGTRTFPPPQRERRVYPQPVYRSRQPSVTTFPPSTVTPVPREVPSNKTIKSQKKPAINAIGPADNGFNLTGETDAQQAVEAEDAIEQLNLGNTGNIVIFQSPMVAEEWREIVRNGVKDEDVEEFLNKYGPNGTKELHPIVLEGLELRQDFAAYSKELAAGGLTDAEKDQALDHLRTGLDEYRTNSLTAGAKPGNYFDSLDENLDNMVRFNDLGKLNEIAWDTTNPITIVMQGVNAAGMGPSMATDMIGIPVYPIAPISDITPSSSGNSVMAFLHNPEANGASISYLLDSHTYTMKPGEQQKLYRTYTASFDPGGGASSKRYRLAEGNYEWRLDGDRWDVVRVNVTATLDASGLDRDFRYLLNNEDHTLRAGERKTLSSSTPIEIAFDRGDGGEPARKLLKSKTYVVGIDPGQTRIDLFAEDDVNQAVAEDPQLASAVTRAKGEQMDTDARVKQLLQKIEGSSLPVSRVNQSAEELLERLKRGVK